MTTGYVCPRCPLCGADPHPFLSSISASQSWCPVETCMVLIWDPSKSAAVNLLGVERGDLLQLDIESARQLEELDRLEREAE